MKISLEVQDDVIDVDLISADGKLNSVQWPDCLNSNSRRLIYHTQVKLFPTYKLILPSKIEKNIKARSGPTLGHAKTFRYYTLPGR